MNAHKSQFGNAAPDRNAVIVISSHVVRGSVGNRAAVFALEILGYPVWAVPTVILPWHPGHGRADRIIIAPEQFMTLISDLQKSPWINEVGAILTGYMGHPDHVAAVAELVKSVKQRNPEVLYLCDPVIGDLGGLYVPEITAQAIRDRLLPLADIASPNRFELSWLTQSELQNNQELMLAAMRAGPEIMLVTSAFPMLEGGTGNLLVHGQSAFMAEHRIVQGPTNGLGDLTGALFLARMMERMQPEKALQKTTAAVFEIMARAAKRGADELMLEADAPSLVTPMAMVQMRRLIVPGCGMKA